MVVSDDLFDNDIFYLENGSFDLEIGSQYLDKVLELYGFIFGLRMDKENLMRDHLNVILDVRLDEFVEIVYQLRDLEEIILDLMGKFHDFVGGPGYIIEAGFEIVLTGQDVQFH